VNQMTLDWLRKLIVAKKNPPSITHAARTAVSAVASLLVARLFQLPEAYWAAITTLVVMQSTLGASLPISAQRLAGNAIGAAFGALVGAFFPGNIIVFGVSVFVIGVFCVAFRLERSAYRYASITLAIVMLVAHSNREWVVAAHRFLEVSIGIAVGLAVSALWPERNMDAIKVPSGGA
jgi:uncharacterized membrane protein YgaE (UPF0421/DUF939 family)